MTYQKLLLSVLAAVVTVAAHAGVAGAHGGWRGSYPYPYVPAPVPYYYAPPSSALLVPPYNQGTIVYGQPSRSFPDSPPAAPSYGGFTADPCGGFGCPPPEPVQPGF
jgi:hypothetical protein